MRIIKEINKGLLKISIFKYNDSYTLKFEKNQNDFTIKFNDGAINEDQIEAIVLSEKSMDHYIDLLNKIEDQKIKNLIEIQGEQGIIFPEIY
jgi:hypothetical protein